jgi:hypothetical protein
MKTKPRLQIGMNEIPFAPILADTIPPVEPPPAPLPVKRPAECRCVAWRHDGGMDNTKHETIERATAFATTLHWTTYYKFALQCGRDMITVQPITAPPYANWFA